MGLHWLLKTIVASETADFVVALHPINRETEIVVAAELEKLDLGGGLLRTLGASDEVRNMLAGLLNNVFGGEDTKLKFPRRSQASIQVHRCWNPRCGRRQGRAFHGGAGGDQRRRHDQDYVLIAK